MRTRHGIIACCTLLLVIACGSIELGAAGVATSDDTTSSATASEPFLLPRCPGLIAYDVSDKSERKSTTEARARRQKDVSSLPITNVADILRDHTVEQSGGVRVQIRGGGLEPLLYVVSARAGDCIAVQSNCNQATIHRDISHLMDYLYAGGHMSAGLHGSVNTAYAGKEPEELNVVDLVRWIDAALRRSVAGR